MAQVWHRFHILPCVRGITHLQALTGRVNIGIWEGCILIEGVNG